MLIPRSSRRNLTRFSAHSRPLFRRNGAFLLLTMFPSVNDLERKNEYHERAYRRFEASFYLLLASCRLLRGVPHGYRIG